jgi:surface carbohydrate biosynthesis protein
MHRTDVKSYPILLVADHKWRDLPAMALLKVILEDTYALPAIAVGYEAVGACLRYWRPRAVVMTTLIGPREQRLAQSARAIGASVIVIPTEGIPGSRLAMMGMFRDPKNWEACDLYLPWGPVMGEFAVSEGYLPKNKVRVAGSGRFDFYQPPLRRCLHSRQAFNTQHGLRPDAPMVTWATTFVIASFVDNQKQLRFNEQDFKGRGLGRIPGFADLPELARQQHAAQALVIEWIRKTCVRFPQVEFVVKPHPYESFAPYERLAACCRADGIGNLHLSTHDYIWDLLNHTALHIHSGSTTGMEAWMVGVPTVNLMPAGYARFRGAEGGALSEAELLDDNQEDCDMLAARVEFYARGGAVATELVGKRRQFLERWFYRLDGCAASRQAAAIADLVKNSQHRHNPSASPPWVGMRTPFRVLQYHLNDLVGREFDEPFFENRRAVPKDFLGQRDKVIRQKDVTAWAARIREALAVSNSPSGGQETHESRRDVGVSR